MLQAPYCLHRKKSKNADSFIKFKVRKVRALKKDHDLKNNHFARNN